MGEIANWQVALGTYAFVAVVILHLLEPETMDEILFTLVFSALWPVTIPLGFLLAWCEDHDIKLRNVLLFNRIWKTPRD